MHSYYLAHPGSFDLSCFTSDRFKNAINDFLDLRLENNDESDQNYNDQNHLNNTHSWFIFKKML